jgi:DNA-binding transcriptional regulator YdaS (Cro superfamily)
MNWMNKLKEYAPDIAGAVLTGGATLPALAMKAIGDAVGRPVNDVDQLGKIVTDATPETMLKIKQADQGFKIRMAELANELTATELGDVQHARDNHKHSLMPAVICCALTVMVAVMLFALFKFPIPDVNDSVIYMVIGQVITLWAGSVAYFVGTTRSSDRKTMMMNKG